VPLSQEKLELLAVAADVMGITKVKETYRRGTFGLVRRFPWVARPLIIKAILYAARCRTTSDKARESQRKKGRMPSARTVEKALKQVWRKMSHAELRAAASCRAVSPPARNSASVASPSFAVLLEARQVDQAARVYFNNVPSGERIYLRKEVAKRASAKSFGTDEDSGGNARLNRRGAGLDDVHAVGVCASVRVTRRIKFITADVYNALVDAAAGEGLWLSTEALDSLNFDNVFDDVNCHYSGSQVPDRRGELLEGAVRRTLLEVMPLSPSQEQSDSAQAREVRERGAGEEQEGFRQEGAQGGARSGTESEREIDPAGGVAVVLCNARREQRKATEATDEMLSKAIEAGIRERRGSPTGVSKNVNTPLGNLREFVQALFSLVPQDLTYERLHSIAGDSREWGRAACWRAGIVAFFPKAQQTQSGVLSVMSTYNSVDNLIKRAADFLPPRRLFSYSNMSNDARGSLLMPLVDTLKIVANAEMVGHFATAQGVAESIVNVHDLDEGFWHCSAPRCNASFKVRDDVNAEDCSCACPLSAVCRSIIRVVRSKFGVPCVEVNQDDGEEEMRGRVTRAFGVRFSDSVEKGKGNVVANTVVGRLFASEEDEIAPLRVANADDFFALAESMRLWEHTTPRLVVLFAKHDLVWVYRVPQSGAGQPAQQGRGGEQVDGHCAGGEDNEAMEE